MEETEIELLLLLLDQRRERLVGSKESRGCCLATQSELLRAPFARQEVLQVWEPACSPKSVSL